MLSKDEEAEVEAKVELATWFLLRNVKNMRLFLHEVWTRYRDGDIALAAASFDMTQAVDIVKGTEVEFFVRFGHVFARWTYRSVLETMVGRRLNTRMFEQLAKIWLELPQEQAEVLMLRTWMYLERFGQTTHKDYVLWLNPASSISLTLTRARALAGQQWWSNNAGRCSAYNSLKCR
jgi:hypothetical protein